MYTVSEDRPRGTSAGQSSREFPVLFHLMDVSRTRASRQSSMIESANLLSAVEQLRWPPADDSEPSSPITTASEPVATTIETSLTVEAANTAPESTVPSSEPAATATENEFAVDEPPAAENSPAEVAADVVEAPSPAPPSLPLVTLRKKPRTSASEDWFASHGKYIAVAFVLALVATIYFARSNREQISVTKQETTSQPQMIDTARNSSPAVPTVQTASAAAPATPSPVELRAPQFVEPSSDKPKDNLFEFAAAKNADDRIAARPDDASKSTAPALTAPALTAPYQPTASEVIATPAPQATASAPETPAYPVTSSPTPHYPVSIPPAAAYPTTAPAQPTAPVLAPPGGSGYQPQSIYGAPAGPPTDYRSQYPVTPASLPQQQPAAQAWTANQPASYPSYDTTARGPRNERTGSGTY